VSPDSARIPSFRARGTAADTADQLGPLAELPGHWRGTGFNLIARPDFQGDNDIFLELNTTTEKLQFDTIGGAIPNRGSAQDDISLFGIHYLDQISDAVTLGALHLEPGVWLNVPATTDPVGPQSVVRLATIPHGNAVLAQGVAATSAGPPNIQAANTVPFAIGTPTPPHGTPNSFPEYDLARPNIFRTDPAPVSQATVTNPNSLLLDAIAGQTITATTRLVIGTRPARGSEGDGGVESIPFLVTNADVAQVSAIFWIEQVEHPSGHGHFLQLQYTQTVLLNFLGLSFPHVSVATLVKAL
jgi:hypothetical protein